MKETMIAILVFSAVVVAQSSTNPLNIDPNDPLKWMREPCAAVGTIGTNGTEPPKDKRPDRVGIKKPCDLKTAWNKAFDYAAKYGLEITDFRETDGSYVFVLTPHD